MDVARGKRGLSLHIGLDRVDPDQYEGWSGDLLACEYDAKDMVRLAKSQGFETSSLLTKKGKADAVIGAIKDAARTLESGDLFFLSYSGHGGQVPDVSDDEPDRSDETWVLYDRQLVDDELYQLWSLFEPGVRILVLSDSCHSGTAVRQTLAAVRPSALRDRVDIPAPNGMRAMPRELVEPVYRAHQDMYDRIQKDTPLGDAVEVQAHVLLLSGCQDNQTSADGQRNGLFTHTLKEVWDRGRFRGGHKRFWREIVSRMPPWQSPNYFTVGPTSRGFERSRPFSI